METKQATVRGRTVQCEYCGEHYSVTYKKCPFCDGGRKVPKYAPEVRESRQSPAEKRKGGGRRVDPKHRGVGRRIVLLLISLVIIVAAVWIVATQVVPIVQERFFPQSSQTGEETNSSDETSQTENNSQDSGQSTSQNSAAETESITLSIDKVTLNQKGAIKQLAVNFPVGSTQSTVHWSSSDSDIVKVSDSGELTAISTGEATVTAALDDGTSATCNVVCAWDEGTLSLNREDFTMSKGDTFQMELTGTSKTPTWSVEDSDIATISGTGLVTAVGRGKTTVTAQVGSQTVECIVRVK